MTITDPRLSEVANLSRFETRAQLGIWLGGGVFCALFAWIGFIPGPLNDRLEYLCFVLTGHIDSRTVGWSAGIVMFVMTMVIVLILAALFRGRRSSPGEDRFERLKLLRTQLRAEGFAPDQLGCWTAAKWRRLFRKTGIVFALIAMIAGGFIYVSHQWLPPSTYPMRSSTLELGTPLSDGLVRLSAVARLDLAFRVSTRNYGVAMLSGDDTRIYRLDAYGFQPVRGSRYHETLYVPLTALDWRPGQPISIFYQCEFSCAINVGKGAARVATNIVVTGVLHRAAMPLYLRRSFEAAGIVLASPYAMLRDEEADPLQPFAIVALISFISAVLFLAMPPFYNWSVTRQARKIAEAPGSFTVQPPIPFVATETIDVEGRRIAVRVVERLQQYHCSVLAAADGSVYLEYPVSVGPVKTDICAVHVFSREEVALRAAGRLDLGDFAATLSEIAQVTGKYERRDGASVGHAAYAKGFTALRHVVAMEAAVLDKIGQCEGSQRLRTVAADHASKVKKWVAEMRADCNGSEPAAVTQQARAWALRLSTVARLIDFTCSNNHYTVEKTAIEKAIQELSMQLCAMQPPVEIRFNRDSVCMADDMESHEGVFSMAPTTRVLELLHEALKICGLASGGSKATWSIGTVDVKWRHQRAIGVLATQWDEPKLVVSPDETVASLFKDGAVGLYFGYRAQSDPDADYQSLRETGRYPAPIVATAETLAQIRQISTGFPSRKPGADAELLHREGLKALLLLVQMEVNVLLQISGAGVFAESLAKMVPQMTAGLTQPDSNELIETARHWGNKLGAIYRLVDARFPAHPRSGDRNSIESAIFEVANELSRLSRAMATPGRSL